MTEQLCERYATNFQNYLVNVFGKRTPNMTQGSAILLSQNLMTFRQRDFCALMFFGGFNEKSFYRCHKNLHNIFLGHSQSWTTIFK